MKKNLLIRILLFSIVLCGCNNDFLDRKPMNKVSEEDVFNNDDLLTAYVNACYHTIPGGFDFVMLSSLTDETHNRHGYAPNSFRQGGLTPDNVTDNNWGWFNSFNYWSSAYEYIRNINVFFEKIESGNISGNLKKRLSGEMKFLRAYTYASLIWRFGGVPIITKVYTLGEPDYSLGRNTYDECVEYILKELEDAIALLPDKMEGDNLGRASADVCKALRSRVYLYWASPFINTNNDKTKWEKVRDASKEVIDLTRYSLSENYKDIFMNGYGNQEVIFCRLYTKANGHSMMSTNTANGYGGNGGNCPLQNLVDDYEMKATGLKPLEAGSGYVPTDPYIGRDPRFYYTVLYNGAPFKGRAIEVFTPGGKDSEQGDGGWNCSQTGYYMCKFLNEDDLLSEPTITPHVLFRLSEFYLNYAEAQYYLGNEEQCRWAVNQIRGRQDIDMPSIPSAITGEDLLNKVYQERRIELALEGHRYYDLRRWKLAATYEGVDAMGVSVGKTGDDTFTYDFNRTVLKVDFKEQYYRLPIPRSEIVKSNDALIQNPGY
ncbi:MAG: RagB/SusD family nutrient uptake outer membrane protein [Tannerella sp.]|jgi:hypothetical protein|nr:RagB/SusD family nutrient uptake outer membrane protein [Tannerella sp.]